MSSTISSTASAASPSASCTAQSFSTFPTKDIGCAVGGTSGFPSNYRSTLKSCCKSAPVEEWANGCALYCLSVDQTVAELQKCWQDGGVRPAEIFCSGNNTAEATGKPSSTGGASQTGSAGQAEKTGNAKNGGSVEGVSKKGLGMVGFVLVSAIFGVVL